MPDRPIPQGRAAEAWARLMITSSERRRLLTILCEVPGVVPEGDATPTKSRLQLAVDAMDNELTILLNLGCPIPGGHDPMAVPEEILGVRRG